jgi:hypothetical protein
MVLFAAATKGAFDLSIWLVESVIASILNIYRPWLGHIIWGIENG